MFKQCVIQIEFSVVSNSLLIFDIAASVQLLKSLKENEVLCSNSLFRCLSPSMSIIPVTVFRSTPSSTTYSTDKITLSV